jgi:O-antigen ligase
VTLSGAPGVDAFAHNEPLEMLLSTGIVGVVVFAAVAALVVRNVRAWKGPIATPVLATVGAAGLVDFVWHFPALGLLSGVVVGATAAHARTADVATRAPTSAITPVPAAHDTPDSVRA